MLPGALSFGFLRLYQSPRYAGSRRPPPTLRQLDESSNSCSRYTSSHVLESRERLLPRKNVFVGGIHRSRVLLSSEKYPGRISTRSTYPVSLIPSNSSEHGTRRVSARVVSTTTVERTRHSRAIDDR